MTRSTNPERAPPAGGDPRVPWWRDLRWIAAGIAGALLALLVWGLFGPESPITVSWETTFLTTPLAADGLPDYGAALLAALGPAPKPEENAAAELLQVMWPLGIAAGDLPLVCKALGIPHLPPPDPLREPTKDAAAKVTDAMFDLARERPWTAAEFPELEAWLVAHEAALDRLVAAADRPRYWLPSPTLLRPGPQLLLDVLLPEMDLRPVARLLVCRAMGHVGAGRHAAAWLDIRAVHRLGRLLAVPENTVQFPITQCLAIAIQAQAEAALIRGPLGAADVPTDVLAAIRRDLDALGPLPRPADGLATERLSFIDAIVGMSRRQAGHPSLRLEMSHDLRFDTSPYRLCSLALHTSLDWDLVLEHVNATYDRLGDALQLPSYRARLAEWERLVGEIEDRVVSRSGWGTAGHACLGSCSRGHRSLFVGNGLELQSLPHTGWLTVLTRGQSSFGLCRTAAALAAWKADRAAGEDPYPDTLDALVPRYLSAVPLDPFREQPFIYERRGAGYLLASVGPNGLYDGGNDISGWIVGGEWQATEQGVDYVKSDLVVRMPVPAASPPPATP